MHLGTRGRWRREFPYRVDAALSVERRSSREGALSPVLVLVRAAFVVQGRSRAMRNAIVVAADPSTPRASYGEQSLQSRFSLRYWTSCGTRVTAISGRLIGSVSPT